MRAPSSWRPIPPFVALWYGTHLTFVLLCGGQGAPSMGQGAPTLPILGGTVDGLSKWFLDQADTPAGSILLFVLVFLTRISIDQYSRKRTAKKHRKRKAA